MVNVHFCSILALITSTCGCWTTLDTQAQPRQDCQAMVPSVDLLLHEKASLFLLHTEIGAHDGPVGKWVPFILFSILFYVWNISPLWKGDMTSCMEFKVNEILIAQNSHNSCVILFHQPAAQFSIFNQYNTGYSLSNPPTRGIVLPQESMVENIAFNSSQKHSFQLS
jgi:hypothetical protein